MSTIEKYIDPPDVDSITKEIYEKRTLKDIVDYVNEIFPGWIILFSDKYSLSYETLTENWHKTCEKLETKPAQILIVDDINPDESHKLTILFCELFTKAGFSVRSKEQVSLCKKCECIYPSSVMHTVMRECDATIPDVWGCCK